MIRFFWQIPAGVRQFFVKTNFSDRTPDFRFTIRADDGLGAVSRNKSGQKSDIVWLGRDPPLPPVKSDTFLKNIFIAFLSSTAFVCYLEMNLFFPTQKSEEKT